MHIFLGFVTFTGKTKLFVAALVALFSFAASYFLLKNSEDVSKREEDDHGVRRGSEASIIAPLFQPINPKKPICERVVKPQVPSKQEAQKQEENLSNTPIISDQKISVAHEAISIHQHELQVSQTKNLALEKQLHELQENSTTLQTENEHLRSLLALSKRQKEEQTLPLVQEYIALIEQYESVKRAHLLELKTLYKIHQKENQREALFQPGNSFVSKTPLGQLLQLKSSIKQFERSLEAEPILPSCEALITRKLRLVFDHFPTVPWLLFSLSTNRFEIWAPTIQAPLHLDETQLKILQEESGELPVHLPVPEGTLLAMDPLKGSPFRLFIHLQQSAQMTQQLPF